MTKCVYVYNIWYNSAQKHWFCLSHVHVQYCSRDTGGDLQPLLKVTLGGGCLGAGHPAPPWGSEGVSSKNYLRCKTVHSGAFLGQNDHGSAWYIDQTPLVERGGVTPLHQGGLKVFPPKLFKVQNCTFWCTFGSEWPWIRMVHRSDPLQEFGCRRCYYNTTVEYNSGE